MLYRRGEAGRGREEQCRHWGGETREKGEDERQVRPKSDQAQIVSPSSRRPLRVVLNAQRNDRGRKNPTRKDQKLTDSIDKDHFGMCVKAPSANQP